MRTKSELIVKGYILSRIAYILQMTKLSYPLGSFERQAFNEEIILIDWEIRELAKLTGTVCIV